MCCFPDITLRAVPEVESSEIAVYVFARESFPDFFDYIAGTAVGAGVKDQKTFLCFKDKTLLMAEIVRNESVLCLPEQMTLLSDRGITAFPVRNDIYTIIYLLNVRYLYQPVCMVGQKGLGYAAVELKEEDLTVAVGSRFIAGIELGLAVILEE